MLCTNQKSSSFSQRKMILSLDFSAEPWNDKYGLLLKSVLVITANSLEKPEREVKQTTPTNSTNSYQQSLMYSLSLKILWHLEDLSCQTVIIDLRNPNKS